MILEVNKFYFPVIGGVETVVKQYSEFLSKHEQVIVLCVKRNFSFFTEKTIINNVKIVRCSSFGTFLSMPLSITFCFKLLLLSRKARVIHLHEPFPLSSIFSLIISRKPKIFVTWHSDIVRQKIFKIFIEFFQKILCNNAEVIFTTSQNLKYNSSILKEFKHKVKVLPLFINTKEYINSQIDPILSSKYPKNYVLYIGRLSYYKGIDFFIKSIDTIENIPILIVGQGKDEKKIKIFKKNKPNIYFINKHVTEEEKLDLIKNCKFLVLPSIFESEAFGIIQLEAMIFSKPVINTNLKTGVPWVSKHNVSGLTVPVKNKRLMCNYIIKLYNDRKLYKKLSIGAKKRVLKFFKSEKIEKKILRYFFKYI